MRYIYKTTNKINGRIYIGQRNFSANKPIEKDTYLGSGTLLLDAIKKYGKKNFMKEILHICETQKEADELEIDEIQKHRKELGRVNVYNMSSGGQFWREGDHAKEVSETMKAWYSKPENKKRMVDGVNNARIRKGMKTLEEQRIINEQNLIKRRIAYRKIREEQALHTAIKIITHKNYIKSDEHKKEVSIKRKQICREVFYREDVLEKFKAGIQARDSDPKYQAQRKVNAKVGRETLKRQAKIAAFGSDHRYYLTSGEFAKHIGLTLSSLTWYMLTGKYKPDAYIDMINKRCAVFDIRKYTNIEQLDLF